MSDSKELAIRIDKAIKHYKVDTGKTFAEIARDLDMSANTLLFKREGQTEWTWTEVVTLSDLIGVPIESLAHD